MPECPALRPEEGAGTRSNGIDFDFGPQGHFEARTDRRFGLAFDSIWIELGVPAVDARGGDLTVDVRQLVTKGLSLQAVPARLQWPARWFAYSCAVDRLLRPFGDVREGTRSDGGLLAGGSMSTTMWASLSVLALSSLVAVAQEVACRGSADAREALPDRSPLRPAAEPRMR